MKTQIIEFRNSFHRNLVIRLRASASGTGLYWLSDRQLKKVTCDYKGCCCGFAAFIDDEFAYSPTCNTFAVLERPS